MGAVVRHCPKGTSQHIGAAPLAPNASQAPGARSWRGAQGGVGSPREKWLQDGHVILHTDSAKSYRVAVPGVLHDRVVHKKLRVKIGRKWSWLAPKYVG